MSLSGRNKKPISALTEMGHYLKIYQELEYDMQFPTIQENTSLQQAVDAKDFYQSLGLHPANWSRWHTMNIEQNPFATESYDYQAFIMMMNGNETKNYLLSIDFAKKLAMQVKTEVGERIRNYFLDCERKASSPATAIPDFTNPAEAARAFADQYEAKQIAQAQVIALQPKAAALDTLSHAKGSLGIRETANAVGIPERKFIARCTNEHKPISSRFMYRDDKNKLRAYAHRIKQGFMTQKITSYAGRGGKNIVTVQVKFTVAGVAHVARLMQNKPVNELRVLEAV